MRSVRTVRVAQLLCGALWIAWCGCKAAEVAPATQTTAPLTASASAAATAVLAPPDPPPSGCLAIVVSNQQHHEDAQGLTSDVKFRERMVRCADHVWTERIRPSWAQPERHEDGHHLPNPDQMARHVVKTQGQLRLELVDVPGRQIIQIPTSEFASVGFKADAETAFNLVSKQTLETMKPLAGRTAAKNARWLELTTERGYHRVHWSDALGLPLEIEVGSLDGRDHEHIVLSFDKSPEAAELPWNKLEGFERHEYDEFLD